MFEGFADIYYNLNSLGVVPSEADGLHMWQIAALFHMHKPFDTTGDEKETTAKESVSMMQKRIEAHAKGLEEPTYHDAPAPKSTGMAQLMNMAAGGFDG